MSWCSDTGSDKRKKRKRDCPTLALHLVAWEPELQHWHGGVKMTSCLNCTNDVQVLNLQRLIDTPMTRVWPNARTLHYLHSNYIAKVRSASFPATTTSLLHIHMSFDPPGILITRQLRRMLRSYRKPMLWLHAFNYSTTSRAASCNLIFSEVTHPDFDRAQLTVRRSTDVIDVVEESRMGDRMAVVQYSAGRLPPICSVRGSGHTGGCRKWWNSHMLPS